MPRSTTCDTKKEKICEEKLSELVKILEFLRDKSLDSVEKQKKIIENVSRLTVRYNIIKDHSLQIYPAQITADVKGEMLEDMGIKLAELQDEIESLFSALNKFRQKHREFETSANELDLKIESSFIQGSPTQKPLQFYLTVFIDILYCFDVFILHIKTYEKMISGYKIETLTKFTDALNLNENFLEYINNVTSSFNCKGSIGL